MFATYVECPRSAALSNLYKSDIPIASVLIISFNHPHHLLSAPPNGGAAFPSKSPALILVRTELTNVAHDRPPISGGRGSVSRWDQGKFEVVVETEDEWSILLEGRELRGRLDLRRREGSSLWDCAFLPAG